MLKVAIVHVDEETGETKILIEHDLHEQAAALGRLKGRKRVSRFLSDQTTRIKLRSVEITDL